MIIAHIKSPAGNRDEEWDDSRITPDEMDFVEDYNAYVIGFKDESGTEQFSVGAKFFWDMYEEFVQLTADKGSGQYPKLTAYVYNELTDVTDNFRWFLGLEKQVTQEAAAVGENLDDTRANGEEAQISNADAHSRLAHVTMLLADAHPTSEPGLTIEGMVQILYGFTIALHDCLMATFSVLDGIASRSKGETYSPLMLSQDMEKMNAKIAQRKEFELRLTDQRKAFLGLDSVAAIRAQATSTRAPAVSTVKTATTDVPDQESADPGSMQDAGGGTGPVDDTVRT